MKCRSCEFLSIALLGDPLSQEDNQEDEAASSKGKESDTQEEIPVADVVGLAETDPLRPPR